MANANRWSILFLLLLCGCAGEATTGTEAAARKHLDAEFRQWMAGQENDVATMESRTKRLLNPVSYDVRSVLPDKPSPLAHAKGRDVPNDYDKWPAYRFNVAIEWRSRSDAPVERITTYTLTWNASEQKWYTAERFE